MGEIDKAGTYTTEVPFSNVPSISGKVVIQSNNSRLNDYLEREIRQLLRDAYYGRVEGLEL